MVLLRQLPVQYQTTKKTAGLLSPAVFYSRESLFSYYMFLIIAEAKSDVPTFVAPSI